MTYALAPSRLYPGLATGGGHANVPWGVWEASLGQTDWKAEALRKRGPVQV
jgi:hypothetical protein